MSTKRQNIFTYLSLIKKEIQDLDCRFIDSTKLVNAINQHLDEVKYLVENHCYTELFSKSSAIETAFFNEKKKQLFDGLIERMEQYAMLNFDREDSVLIAESGQEKALFNSVNMLGVELKERLEGMQIQRNEIVAANDRLKSLLKEKEILLKEVHHRVKNNLQVVLGLIKIQHRRLESVEVKEMLRESEARITMIAMVHEQLCLMENLAFVQINDYLNSLLSLIANIYEKKYSLIFRSSVQKNCTLSADKTVSFGLLINEIISNAVKHASPKGGGGDIGVLLSPCSKGLLLVVKDRGIGMDTSFMTKECTIGMSLIHSLAAQLEFDLNFIDAQGLTVEIILPRGTYN